VHRSLGQQAEQVEPQVSVREDRRTHAFTVRSTLTSPPTELTRRSTQLLSSCPNLPV
jgi:hypothetical protein